MLGEIIGYYFSVGAERYNWIYYLRVRSTRRGSWSVWILLWVTIGRGGWILSQDKYGEGRIDTISAVPSNIAQNLPNLQKSNLMLIV